MKSSKYLTLFIGLFIGLNTVLFVVLQKYYLLLLHQTIFYCQEMAKTLSLSLPSNTGVVLFSFISAVLLIAVIKFIRTTAKIFNLRKNLIKNTTENTRLTQLLKKLRLESQVVVVNSQKPYAFCFGVRKPKIYVSTTLIEILLVQELEVVLLHEKYHLENRDTTTLMMATIFESLLPFFPLISDFIHQYRIERELAADKAACEAAEGSKHLSTVLAKLLRFDMERAHVVVPAIADASTLETRIKRLTNKKYSSRQLRFKNVVTSLASVSFLFVLALTPIQAFELHSEDRDVMMVCTQWGSCESACRDSSAKILQSSVVLYGPFNTLP